jgi:hypothetical protein
MLHFLAKIAFGWFFKDIAIFHSFQTWSQSVSSRFNRNFIFFHMDFGLSQSDGQIF